MRVSREGGVVVEKSDDAKAKFGLTTQRLNLIEREREREKEGRKEGRKQHDKWYKGQKRHKRDGCMTRD
jgi:hypothetical protein